MERAYFRGLIHTHQCELVFDLRVVNESDAVVFEDHVRSVRQLSDTIESLIQHTKNKILKLLADKKEEIELNISLSKGDTNIEGSSVCKDIITQFCKPPSPIQSNNIILKVCKQTFVVVVNAPLIITISLPNIIYAEYQIQATKFKAVYTEKHLCKDVWFTSTNKSEWKEVGKDYKYTPSIDDLGKYIKLMCIPYNDRVEGPPFEVVSLTTVQKMFPLPKCPFEERHKYTPTRLKDSELRIVSYNTLSSLYCDAGRYPSCQPEFLSIDYRKQLILKELKGYKADIICLQELDYYIFKHYLKKELSKHYKGIFHKKGNRISEGLGFFYCSKRFKLMDVMHLVFAQQLRSNRLFKSTWKLLQLTKNLKDNIVKHPTSLQVCVLMRNGTRDIIIVANTHLYYHIEASEIRLIQGSLALEYIETLAYSYQQNHKTSKVGVIFCGDFNSVPESTLFNFFTSGMIHHTFEVEHDTPLRDVCLKHPFQFESAYGKPLYTNYTDDFKGCLDYIFYETNKFSLSKFIPLPDVSVLTENTALPSKVFPSDHVALVTNLRML